MPFRSGRYQQAGSLLAYKIHNSAGKGNKHFATMAPNDYDDDIEEDEEEDSIDEEVAVTKKRRTAKKWKGKSLTD